MIEHQGWCRIPAYENQIRQIEVDETFELEVVFLRRISEEKNSISGTKRRAIEEDRGKNEGEYSPQGANMPSRS